MTFIIFFPVVLRKLQWKRTTEYRRDVWWEEVVEEPVRGEEGWRRV